VREIDLDQFSVAVDYVGGFSDQEASVGELALINSVLSELMLELMAAECTLDKEE
jgi:hypothetical protein